MGKSQRDKGARGQREAHKILVQRGWTVDPITAGVKREDMIATDPIVGGLWSVEVKNHKLINMCKFRQQAREQAKVRNLPYLLMVKIPDSRWWYVEDAIYSELWRLEVDNA